MSSAITVFAVGQAPSPETLITPEGAIAIPVASAPLGQKDSGAVAELTNYLAVVGPSIWTGLQAKGKFTHGSNEGIEEDATLYTLGGTEFRLDEQTGTGTTSIRIQNTNGKIQDSDGNVSLIPPNTAAMGLFSFQKLCPPNGLGTATSLLDRGMATVGGVTLHRLTYEFAGTGNDPATHTAKVLAIDYYFDSVTHLLVKSAYSGQFPDSGLASFLFVVTYSDYRHAGASAVPYRYSETVDGEPYRSLQLSDVQLNPAFDIALFQF